MPEENVVNDWLDQLAEKSEPKETEPKETEPKEEDKEVEPTEDQTDDGQEDNQEGETEDGDGEDTNDEPEQKDTRANEAFARMRKENTQYKRTISRMAKNLGITEAELLEQIENNAIEKEAKANNMSPEALRRLEKLEQENAQYKQSQRMDGVVNKMNEVKSEFGLSSNDIRDFATHLVESGVDLLNNTVDLKDIYRGVHFEKLVESRIEEARQEWIKHDSKADSAAKTSNKKGSSKSEGSENINSTTDLNSFLDQLG